MNIFDIIQKPILSEKSFAGVATKTYTFKVAKNATKPMIKNAVEEIFKVKVESIRTARYDGKPKRQGRTSGTTSAWKKAYVQLTKESKAIEFFEGLQ